MARAKMHQTVHPRTPAVAVAWAPLPTEETFFLSLKTRRFRIKFLQGFSVRSCAEHRKQVVPGNILIFDFSPLRKHVLTPALKEDYSKSLRWRELQGEVAINPNVSLIIQAEPDSDLQPWGANLRKRTRWHGQKASGRALLRLVHSPNRASPRCARSSNVTAAGTL
jgi:hypothetical protein